MTKKLTKEEKDNRKYKRRLLRIKENNKNSFYADVGSFLSTFENSKSSRSRCSGCREIIGKNTLRGHKRVERFVKPFVLVRKYCLTCSLKLIELDIRDLKEGRRRVLKEMKKKKRKEAMKEQESLRVKDKMLRAIENEI